MVNMATATDKQVGAVCTALLRNAERLAEVLRQISDPTSNAIGSWSIGETANHVAGSHEYFLAAARGDAALESLDDVDTGNARSLADDPERDPSVLADRLETGVQGLVRYAAAVQGNPVVQPFSGVEVPLSTLLAIELGEVLVHGYDIAHAAGLSWRIEPADALVAHRELLALFPYLLDRRRATQVRVTAEIRIRGMDPVVVDIHDGILEVDEAAGQKADFTMSVDPAAYLLIYFNRVNPLTQMLRGNLVLWGRRPWRIQTFQSAFVT